MVWGPPVQSGGTNGMTGRSGGVALIALRPRRLSRWGLELELESPPEHWSLFKAEHEILHEELIVIVFYGWCNHLWQKHIAIPVSSTFSSCASHENRTCTGFVYLHAPTCTAERVWRDLRIWRATMAETEREREREREREGSPVGLRLATPTANGTVRKLGDCCRLHKALTQDRSSTANPQGLLIFTVRKKIYIYMYSHIQP